MEYNVGGIKMRIGDIKKMSALTDKQARKGYDLQGRLLDGLNQEAYSAYEDFKMTRSKEEFGITDKKIIIPSFGTTSKLFSQHFAILRDLRHKIDLLKQAYEFQRSDKRSWE